MAVRLQQPCGNLVASSSSSSSASNSLGFCTSLSPSSSLSNERRSRIRRPVPAALALHCRWIQVRKRAGRLTPLKAVSPEDGVAINGTPVTPQAADEESSSGSNSSRGEVREMRAKLDQALQDEDGFSSGLTQSLHDAARSMELAIMEQGRSRGVQWFSKAWLGIDENAWLKTLSYQAAVYSLLQAAIEITARVDRRDRDVNISVQRSLLRISAPLEGVIREATSAKKPAVSDWFWSHQHPVLVTTFVNLLERDHRFIAATTESRKGVSSASGSSSDLSLLMLVLSCISAITKLGLAKVSCSQFLSMVPDVTGRLMDTLVDFVPIRQAYFSIKEIGLRREFLLHFGPRAASRRVHNDQDVEEVAFWVDLVQRQLQQAIDRERIWSRLTTCESIEILEKDLAIFGFFIALGRSTQLYLSVNGYPFTDSQIQSVIRYLIGGSVLYYPQLSSISSYQLYVEVVCEELDWLPFYGTKLVSPKLTHGEKSLGQGLPYAEVVSQILDVCSHWTTTFIKYSSWIENPSNIKAARFLSKCHSQLKECIQDLGSPNTLRNKRKGSISETKVEKHKCGSSSYLTMEKDLDKFDEALESVEEAINKLEGLLQELHLSSSNTGKEHLEAACSDLERIRKLKKEAEFLEASFRAKAASLEANTKENMESFENDQNSLRMNTKDSEYKTVGSSADSKPRGLWNYLAHHFTKEREPEFLMSNDTEIGDIQTIVDPATSIDIETNEIRRFEALRHELIELEKRVMKSTHAPIIDEVSNLDDGEDYADDSENQQLLKASPEENFVAKSINKLKETSTDVLQGTQLLAIDVGAAVGLMQRSVIGDELTEKEKQALKRTLTDLASVIPIGILMLLPVTAVGHAAMLAAIQRYVPALIPSTYAPERLDLLRQLEKVKEMEDSETESDENEPKRY